MTAERLITLETSDDASLPAIVHEPATLGSDIGVLVVVGGPQYRVGSHRQFTLMSRALATSGIASMRFDCAGMGDASGPTADFLAIGADIGAAVAAFLAAVPRLKGVALWGLCDGASASLLYASGDQRVRGLILVNPWVRTGDGEAKAYLRHYYMGRLFSRALWKDFFAGRLGVIKALRGLLQTIRRANATPAASRSQASSSGSFIDRMRQSFAKFSGPTLFLISERDLTAKEFVDMSRGDGWRALVERQSVSMEHLPGADHTFSSRVHLDRAARLCADWLRSRFAGART
jgi:exosortase A-associated hydrolase 1